MKNIELFKIFSKYYFKYRNSQLILMFLLLISTIGSLATPYVLKIIIDDIFPNGNINDLVTILSILLAVYVIRIGSNLIREILNSTISQKIVADIRSDITKNIINRPMAYFKKINHGEVIHTVMNDVHVIQNALSLILVNFINDLFSIVGILVMLFTLNFELTLISLCVIPLILITVKKFTPKIQNSFQKVQENEQNVSTYYIEKLNNIRVIKSFNTEDYEQRQLHKLSSNLIAAYKENAIFSSFNSNIITFLIAIGPVIVLVWGGLDVFSKVMSIGSLVAFIQYLNRLYGPTMGIMNNYNQFQKSLISMKRVSKYLDGNEVSVEPSIDDYRQHFKKFYFRNVNLEIDGRKILHNLNMVFEKGKIYGLLGPSGSGKTSVINLICQFVNPTSGNIHVDNGLSISQIKLWNLELGLIEKENQLFNGTILENVKYGTFNSSTESVDWALEKAHLSDVLMNLKEGHNTKINNTGTMLSDGQKQRISIARSFLKKPSIIIFDEATSSLDSKLAFLIINNLKIHFRNSIVIIITHGKNLVNEFDYIYYLEKGQLTKRGRPGSVVGQNLLSEI